MPDEWPLKRLFVVIWTWADAHLDLRTLIYITFAVAVLTYFKFVLKWSASEFLLKLLAEFRELAQLRVTRGAVNAVLVIFLIAFVILYFVSTPLKALISLMGLMQPPQLASGGTGIEAIVLFGLVAACGLVSVSLVDKQKGD